MEGEAGAAIEPSTPGVLAGAGVGPAEERPRSQRHPAAYRHLGAVALYFGYRAIAALLLATPLSLLAARVVGGYPRGDAVLFEPGALMLAEALRTARIAVAPLSAQLGVGAVLAAALGLIPLAALIAALGAEGRPSALAVLGRAARALGPLTLLWGVALAAEVAAFALVFLPGAKLVASLSLDPRARDLAGLGVFAVSLLAAGGVGVLHDLARVAIVDEQRGFYTAVARGLEVLSAAPLAAVWAFTWRGALAVAALAGGALLASVAFVSTAALIVFSFGAPLAALAAASFLRASWLAAALRLLRQVQDRTLSRNA